MSTPDATVMEDAINSLNQTSVIPVEYRCLVEVDPVENKTSGGVELPPGYLERQQMSAIKGTLLALGGNAFQDWGEPHPKRGDRVVLNKYAGITGVADANDRVRLVQDKDILAILRD